MTEQFVSDKLDIKSICIWLNIDILWQSSYNILNETTLQQQDNWRKIHYIKVRIAEKENNFFW